MPIWVKRSTAEWQDIASRLDASDDTDDDGLGAIIRNQLRAAARFGGTPDNQPIVLPDYGWDRMLRAERIKEKESE
jgi:hypothetical protein